MIPVIFGTAYYAYLAYKAYEAYQEDSIIPLLEGYSGFFTVAQYVPYAKESLDYLDSTVRSVKDGIKSKGLVNYGNEKFNSVVDFYNNDNKAEVVKGFWNSTGGQYFNKDTTVQALDTIKGIPQFLKDASTSIDDKFQDSTPTEIILYAFGVTVAIYTGSKIGIEGVKYGASYVHNHQVAADLMSKTYETGDVIISKAFEDNKDEYEAFKTLGSKLLKNTAKSAYEAVKPDVNVTQLYDEWVVTPLGRMDSNKTVDYLADIASYYGNQISNFGNTILFGNQTDVSDNVAHEDL